ncbi:MAG: NTP transferase domain-containing protein [Thermodesulfobacteriota bacterium]|nr:NTP transferase domain-containing protein [Thermodesulfobacteriota bacterium]
MAENLAVLILAAGKGTRMKSDLVKVLHPLMGQPMLAHVVNSARYLKPDRTVLVVGRQAEEVKANIKGEGLTFVLQEEQLGTGHAVAQAREALADFKGTVLILSGDVPLLSAQTMMDFLAAHRQSGAPLSVLTVELMDPAAYGRIIRDKNGYLLRIVEARDATAEELAVCEINTGIYAVDAGLLFDLVTNLGRDNDQKEYYLTDLVAMTRDRDMLVAAILSPDPEEVLGINDRADLAEAIAILKVRTNYAWMLAGVTMIDPDTTYIETTVKLARDVTLWPNTLLLGRTSVGPGAAIGPNCQLMDAVVGAGATVKNGAFIEQSKIPDGAVIGPQAVIGPK